MKNITDDKQEKSVESFDAVVSSEETFKPSEETLADEEYVEKTTEEILVDLYSDDEFVAAMQNLGWVDAQTTPDALAEKGIEFYDMAEYEKALLFFKVACERGSVTAKSYIGLCYRNGQGVEKDLDLAYKYTSEAAALGDSTGIIGMGMFYFYGLNGIKQDMKKAVEFFRQASDAGNLTGTNNLASCYLEGNGVQKNYKKAIQLFTEAAEKGNTFAMYNLGKCYYNGKGLPQDKNKAYYWISKSADNYHIGARVAKGLMLFFGEGTEGNIDEAIELWKWAASKGDKDAVSHLKNFARIDWE